MWNQRNDTIKVNNGDRRCFSLGSPDSTQQIYEFRKRDSHTLEGKMRNLSIYCCSYLKSFCLCNTNNILFGFLHLDVFLFESFCSMFVKRRNLIWILLDSSILSRFVFFSWTFKEWNFLGRISVKKNVNTEKCLRAMSHISEWKDVAVKHQWSRSSLINGNTCVHGPSGKCWQHWETRFLLASYSTGSKRQKYETFTKLTLVGSWFFLSLTQTAT